MLLYLLIILFGIGGGILAGLLGIGGGIIYVLILPRILSEAGIPDEQIVQFTIANSLFGIFFASLIANVLNIYRKEFYLIPSMLVSIPGAAASLVILTYIVIQHWYNPTMFNSLLIIFLFYMLVQGIRQFKKQHESQKPSGAITYLVAGLSGGTLSALTGLGGGAIVVPILNTQLKLDIKKARSISLVMIMITSMVLTLANLLHANLGPLLPNQYGLIYLPAALPLTVGVLAGTPLGSHLGTRLSSNRISFIFGFLLMIVIIEKSFQLYHSF